MATTGGIVLKHSASLSFTQAEHTACRHNRTRLLISTEAESQELFDAEKQVREKQTRLPCRRKIQGYTVGQGYQT